MRIGEVVYFSPRFRFIDLDPADAAGFVEALSVSCRRLGRERLIWLVRQSYAYKYFPMMVEVGIECFDCRRISPGRVWRKPPI